MFDRLVEIFCDFDDFCKAVKMEWEAMLVTEENKPAANRGTDRNAVCATAQS